MPVFKRNKFERFHGDVQDANTLRKKRSNRDTEKSQKVHSFAQLICQGLEIWFVASLYGVLQIWSSDFENFENFEIWPFYGWKTAKNGRPYWMLGSFSAIKQPKSETFKIATPNL